MIDGGDDLDVLCDGSPGFGRYLDIVSGSEDGGEPGGGAARGAIRGCFRRTQ